MESQIAEKIQVSPNVPVKKRRRDRLVDLWAKLPLVLRVAAASALALSLVGIGIGYWRLRDNIPFVMKGQEPQLTMEVLSVVNGYERRVTNGDKLQMLLRADRETTFADKRHELDNIFLENYPENSEVPDRVTATKAVYKPDPANPENFTIAFSGNVNFETRDNLKAQTEQIVYDKQREFAETGALIKFSRDNISGSAVGARMNVKDKHLDLLNQVEINVAPTGKLAKNSLTDFGSSAVKINSTRASFDQELAQFELQEGVNIIVTPQNSEIVPTTIRAEKAVYHKEAQKLDLSGDVEIVSASDNVTVLTATNQKSANPINSTVPVTIRANAASYEQGSGKVHLNGNASVEQGGELMNGERITADLSKQKKLQNVSTKGDAFLRTASPERTTEINASEMNFKFDANQQIQLANAAGSVKVRSVSGDNAIDLTGASALILNFKPLKDKSLLEKMTTTGNTNVNLTAASSADYSNVQMLAPNSTEVLFAAQNDKSVLKQMTTDGRTTVVMTAPQSQTNNPKATNKKIIADSLRLLWNAAGKDLNRAEAVGNAELYVFPLGSAPNLDKNSLFAARFDCDFYEIGNLARTFTASGKAKAILEPTVASPERGVRNLFADKMTASFERGTQAVESFNAVGNTKFNELDRNGVAESFVYTASDEIVRLRGGEPTVWDSRARLKAVNIDWKTRQQVTTLRGKVATTYYSQEQTGGSTPFAKVNSPVFIVSNDAEFNHVTGVAVYTGNARAWQENNFVRAEKLVLQRDTKSMFGEGAVQSALYNAKRRENGKETTVPVFAASDRMSYSDAQKLLRYESNVDIRQGTDRMMGGVAEVYLNAVNEVDKTVTQTNVVVTQPGRRATGDWAQYTAADEVIILRGNPATVEDAAQGGSTGRQISVYLRENRVEGQGGTTATAPGRVRSTHKIT
ncbi:MAG: LPS export ABC transporter periplasmic protein LptC, partial [Pyrinomonadaceae bacterium]